jgi:hypothetical protein
MRQDFYSILAENSLVIESILNAIESIRFVESQNTFCDIMDTSITKENVFCNNDKLLQVQKDLESILKESIISFINSRNLDNLLSKYGITQKDVILELIEYN